MCVVRTHADHAFISLYWSWARELHVHALLHRFMGEFREGWGCCPTNAVLATCTITKAGHCTCIYVCKKRSHMTSRKCAVTVHINFSLYKLYCNILLIKIHAYTCILRNKKNTPYLPAASRLRSFVFHLNYKNDIN